MGKPSNVLEKPEGAAASLPLLFHDHHTQHDRDPQALAERLAQNHPVLDFAPLHGHAAGFVHRTNTIRAGSLLLHPRLDAVLAVKRQGGGVAPRERVFEELVEWVRANLHAPINLTALERRSGYSRRTLQLAFQQRFGCGPVQWVRRQRLEQARQALLQPQPGDTVSSVAVRFGFQNLAAFSRAFRAEFGLKPSELIHEGRRTPS